MLQSVALMLFFGFALGGILKKLRLPPLIGMLAAGVLLGPHVFNLIDPSILNISADLRRLALLVILIRAGLSLDLSDLKKVGRPALLLCFVPATAELFAILLLAPPLLGISRLDAAVMGTVLAAVSPAVVVPRMLKLMKSGRGTNKKIPQMILAGASVDDIYVLVLFAAFTGMYGGDGFRPSALFGVPVSILTGCALGILSGVLLAWCFKRFHIRDTVKLLLLLGTACLFTAVETALEPYLPLSGMLAVIAMGVTLYKKRETAAKRLSAKYEKLWVGAELLLFILVGAAVDITYISKAGPAALLLIALALLIRMAGVFLCLIKTNLNKKERLFTAIAYLPKATVQAAIGGIPLALGVSSGNTILTVAVLAILITAPLGAIGMDIFAPKLLQKIDTQAKNNG